MLLDARPYTLDRLVRLGMGTALAALFVWTMGYLSDVLIPFAAALLLAYLINPLVELLQRRVRHRGLAVVISLVLLGALGAGALMLIVPAATAETARAGKLVLGLVQNSDLARRAAENLPPDLWGWLKDFVSRPEVQDFFKADGLAAAGSKFLGKAMPGLMGLLSGTASLIVSLVGATVVGMYLFFLLLDYPAVTESLRKAVPPALRGKVFAVAGDFEAAMNRYVRAQAGVALGTGVLLAFGFWLVGLPLPLLLGLGIGVLNMVPYLQILGVFPAAGLAVVHGLESDLGIGASLALTAAVFIAVQLVQDLILSPRLLGKATGMSPALILLSISVWGKLLGLLGLLIALPMTCLLWAYYRKIIEPETEAQPSPAAANTRPD